MPDKPVLVVGATGHVGSQIVTKLAGDGRSVRALVRESGKLIHGAPRSVEYVVGDLNDPESLRRAVSGAGAVVATANAIVPTSRKDSVGRFASSGYDALIGACEKANVERFVFASVPKPPTKVVDRVPQLKASFAIEKRLERSPVSTVVVRNPAFMDIWLVMTGCVQAAGTYPHRTVGRQYGFMQRYIGLVGNLVAKRGILLAPGGAAHGSPFISTRDVALMQAAAVDLPRTPHRVLEAGGPAWVTWKEVAQMHERRLGRRVRCVPMWPWLLGASRLALRPFSAAASNILALTQFVATYQPRWDSAPVVRELGLPPQETVADYLDKNLEVTGRQAQPNQGASS